MIERKGHMMSEEDARSLSRYMADCARKRALENMEELKKTYWHATEEQIVEMLVERASIL